nr:hypothetical protein [Clostridia bacterium]
MEIIVILVMSIITIITLTILSKFSLKKIKLIKKIGEDKKLNELTNTLPENEQIAKEILKKLKNDNVKIKTGGASSQASLYIVATNTIFIANIKNTFTRIQTIAHECIHSIQDKTLLWFNFIFSNIYILYWIIITILTLFNKIANPNIHAIILVMMSITLFFVRSYIETDAMTKARFLAKEYMESKKEVITKKNIETIIENYDKINNIGIKFTNLSLIVEYLVKVIIYCVIALI